MRFGRSLLIVRPLRAGSSFAIHRTVERAVKTSPQGSAQKRLDAAPAAGEDCGMSIAFAVISAAIALGGLPQLPERGLALETKAGVQLQTLGRRPLATLPGLDLASDRKIGGDLVLRDRGGHLFRLDARARRLRRFYEYPQHPPGCRGTGVSLTVCARTIDAGGHVLARAPRGSPSGYWEWAERAPDGKALLAQWVGECEVPVAYIVAAGKLRAVGRVSVALGWLARPVALVHIVEGDCGLPRATGIYAVPRRGSPRLVLRAKRLARYAMWGG